MAAYNSSVKAIDQKLQYACENGSVLDFNKYMKEFDQLENIDIEKKNRMVSR